MSFKRIGKLSNRQVRQLHQLYQKEWWTKGRTLPDVKIMLRNTDIIVGVGEERSGRLIAFARVLTDKVYKALILDVIVDAKYRARGLGREIMQMILDHPELRAVKHFELYCLPDLIPFYKKWGFTDDLGELTTLRLYNKNK
jgi:predicted GNAT family N-acyltransferase